MDAGSQSHSSSLPVLGLREASVVTLNAQALTVVQAPPLVQPKHSVTRDSVRAVTYCGASSPLLLVTLSPPAETTNVDCQIPLGATWYAAPLFWEIMWEEGWFWANA